MLVIGNNLSYEQARAQMSLWAMLSAPLLMSNDLRSIEPALRNDLLLNRNLLAVNQDRLGRIALPMPSAEDKRIDKDSVQMWSKEMIGGRRAFLVYYAHPYGVAWYSLEFWIAIVRYLFARPAPTSLDLVEAAGNQTYALYDLFSGDLVAASSCLSSRPCPFRFDTFVRPFGGLHAFWLEPLGSGKESSSVANKLSLWDLLK